MGVKMNVGTVLLELDSMNRYLSDVWMKSGTLGKAFRSFEGPWTKIAESELVNVHADKKEQSAYEY